MAAMGAKEVLENTNTNIEIVQEKVVQETTTSAEDDVVPDQQPANADTPKGKIQAEGLKLKISSGGAKKKPSSSQSGNSPVNAQHAIVESS